MRVSGIGWLALCAAALLAAAISYTLLRLVTRLSSCSRSWALICRVCCAALTLGVALWGATLLSVLALSSHWGLPGTLAPFAPLPVAVLGLAATLVVLIGRSPDALDVFASGATLAATTTATCVMLIVGLGDTHPVTELLPALSLAFGAGAAAASAALGLRFGARGGRTRRARSADMAATVLGALAILVIQVGTLALGDPLLPVYAPAPGVPYLILALTALGLAGLGATHTVNVYELRLALKTGQCARELEEVHTRLQYLATHDSLTGLPNWHFFRERLAHAVADTDRPGRAIAVAVLDLDHFSSLNHSLGHAAGDWLLTEVALRVGAVIRPNELLARLGSDEFVVLIDSVAARIEAHATTAAILAALKKPISINGAEVPVRPSIGVSVWPDDGRRVDDLLAHAEVAMAAAKRHGGNAVRFFERGMTDSMHERLALENDLRRAMSAGEFEMWFQPVISARSGRIVTAEALLRWRHPERGLISPNSFIPLAEETGLMITLGEWVVHEVCRHASLWELDRGSPIRLAVNLSATQFRHQNLVEVIRTALEERQLDARCLEIELTESSVMTNPEESVGVLKQLRRMGVTVAVDDFGTGYSSLSYLRRFPIDKLKIDRSFVRDLLTSRTDESIVRAIISLAHSVGLQVVAEGVETEEQLERVRALGCDQWQGYYCCEPQPAERFGFMLAEQSGTRTGLVAALTRATLGSDDE
jgi:diguanylate cyclase